MRKIVVFAFAFLMIACSKDKKDERIETINTILLLRVDYMTYKFEGGTEQTISKGLTNSDTIPISVDYKSPGDFGNISLYYQPTNDLIFDGSIIWMGTGVIAYPKSFTTPDNYPTISTNSAQPDNSRFQKVFYSGSIDYSKIWSSVSNLSIVSEYLKSNKKIGLFLYTPSVGVGNPYEWDWFVIMSK